MWHSLDAATSFCQHTHQEWRHTRAERSTRYRKCALLPIHDSQLTIHNSQFTICLKCLLGGSCQTQTKLIYARHRQANRETNSHTDRQTNRQAGRERDTRRDSRRDSAHLDLAEPKRLDPFWHLHLKELSS